MPLSDFQERAFNLLIQDPVAGKELQKHLHRIDPKIPLSNLPDVKFETQVSDVVKPLEEKIDKLTRQLEEKRTVDVRESEWSKLKRLGWKDEQITELEERMSKDPDNNLYGSYLAAAKYYQGMDQPLLPNSAGARRGISGRRISDKDSWREQMEDPKSPLRSGNRNERRKAAQKDWAQATNEFRNQ
jgi:hypothetical protein